MAAEKVTPKYTPASFSYIDINSKHYKDAASLRYDVFFKEFNLDPDVINDSQEKSSIHLAAVTDGKVAGYGRLSIDGNTAQISQMAVQDKMRGKGIGSRIMTLFIGRSKQEGCRSIFLNARIGAVSFYQRFGFKCTGSQFPSKKTGLAHIRMERQLMEQ